LRYFCLTFWIAGAQSGRSFTPMRPLANNQQLPSFPGETVQFGCVGYSTALSGMWGLAGKATTTTTNTVSHRPIYKPTNQT
jgi:hypothetical protein